MKKRMGSRAWVCMRDRYTGVFVCMFAVKCLCVLLCAPVIMGFYVCVYLCAVCCVFVGRIVPRSFLVWK